MNRAAVERFTKMAQLQAEMLVGELVAGGSFAGMQSEKARPHQSALHVWSYFPIFLENQTLSSPEHRRPNSSNSKSVKLCASFDWNFV